MLKKIDLSGIEAYDTEILSYAFCNCEELEEIIGFKTLRASGVRHMEKTFYGCRKLKRLDFSDWRMFRLEEAYRIFYRCRALEEINFRNAFKTLGPEKKEDFGAWRDMSQRFLWMFEYCYNLKRIDFTGCKIYLKQMRGMFTELVSLEEVEGLELICPEDLYKMFQDCHKLKRIDVSLWNLKNAKYVSNAFENCYELEEVVGLNILDLSNVRYMVDVFKNCHKLKRIRCDGMKFRSGVEIEKIFDNCYELEEVTGINYEDINILGCSKGCFKLDYFRYMLPFYINQ